MYDDDEMINELWRRAVPYLRAIKPEHLADYDVDDETGLFERVSVCVEDDEDESPWKTFKFSLNYEQVKIDYFYETVIFQQDIPVRCTRVVLSDGTSVLAKLQHDTFGDKYKEFVKLVAHSS